MQELIHLYRELTGNAPERVAEIPGAVSTRRYFRIYGNAPAMIGTYSPDTRETVAFTSFAKTFRGEGIRVPEVFAVSEDQHFYLQEDLGDQRLHERVAGRTKAALDDELMDHYDAALRELVKMQFLAKGKVDYAVCVPRPAFDRQSVLWDLNHFKYYFLKPSGTPFDEQLLEDAFTVFADAFEKIPADTFMFRDFQTRNIMLHEGASWLIDFQGGRKGPLQYDLASLVYEARAALTPADRLQIMERYTGLASAYGSFDRDAFMDGFYPAALIRILQALGAYGLRGMVEKKAVFLQSIPMGLANLQEVLSRLSGPSVSTYFRKLLEDVAATKGAYRIIPPVTDDLTLTVYSFSYRKPLPDDLSGNGGGFVYDCRFLENPGKQESLATLTGLDAQVQAFLEKDPEVKAFTDSIRHQADAAIRSYQARGFKNLMFSFGCTGGQHRSVYFAHTFAEWCRSKSGVRVIEIHRELDRKI